MLPLPPPTSWWVSEVNHLSFLFLLLNYPPIYSLIKIFAFQWTNWSSFPCQGFHPWSHHQSPGGGCGFKPPPQASLSCFREWMGKRGENREWHTPHSQCNCCNRSCLQRRLGVVFKASSYQIQIKKWLHVTVENQRKTIVNLWKRLENNQMVINSIVYPYI